jgi:hypothetical protein
MHRATTCALVLATAGLTARAGELDRESSRAVPSFSAATAQAAADLAHTSGSEMDRESPQSSHGWRWGVPHYGWGWGWGGGWGGFYRPYIGFGFGYPGYFGYRPFGFYSPFYTGYYSAFGWPYHAYFPAYYHAPAAYGWWW